QSAPFSLPTVSVVAGDTIDFVAGHGGVPGNRVYLTARLAPSLNPAPELPLLSASLFEGAGDQVGLGIGAGTDGIYVAGTHASGTYVSGTNNGNFSLALKYGLPAGPAPLWATAWPSASPSPVTQESLHSVATTSEGAYFAGWSWMQTIDSIGDKEHKSVLVKFPQAGATGTDVGGSLWVARPQLFSFYQGFE
ncbi:MAG: hypothetical protein C4321_10100, partial [Chloroflexota bacterium]